MVHRLRRNKVSLNPGEMTMHYQELDYEVVIVGGGLAGYSAAVAAARGGAKTCLIQDRPVLGNSSSEIRVTPHGQAVITLTAPKPVSSAKSLMPNEPPAMSPQWRMPGPIVSGI